MGIVAGLLLFNCSRVVHCICRASPHDASAPPVTPRATPGRPSILACPASTISACRVHRSAARFYFRCSRILLLSTNREKPCRDASAQAKIARLKPGGVGVCRHPAACSRRVGTRARVGNGADEAEFSKSGRSVLKCRTNLVDEL